MKALISLSSTPTSASTVPLRTGMPRGCNFSEDELPDDQQAFLALNAELADLWPNITEKKDAPADAEEWNGVPDKLQYLER